ncbi:hypothetical protein HYX19_01820 [Candidatus Woesearchaeota archaeon]|nr:hypothetical protein [Candidatus Woesearchaeota archaeon]
MAWQHKAAATGQPTQHVQVLVSRSDGKCGIAETAPALRKPTEEVQKTIGEVQCENGICEEGEESSCPQDCIQKKSYLWLWILVFSLIILIGLFFYSYYNYRKKGGKPGIKNYINYLLEKLKPKKKITMAQIGNIFSPAMPKYGNQEEAFEKLVEYMKNSLEKGQNEKQVITLLVKSGWTRRDIDRAIRKARLSAKK